MYIWMLKLISFEEDAKSESASLFLLNSLSVSLPPSRLSLWMNTHWAQCLEQLCWGYTKGDRGTISLGLSFPTLPPQKEGERREGKGFFSDWTQRLQTPSPRQWILGQCMWQFTQTPKQNANSPFCKGRAVTYQVMFVNF